MEIKFDILSPVQQLGAKVKWLVASIRNDVMGFSIIAVLVGIALRLFVF